ncbi:MAG: PSD1 domain-containing protein [Armatimonadetes bacterium]|nr:PSD1 domain-containing protein [Armatimonadota bacterium]
MSWARFGVLAVCGAPWAAATVGGSSVQERSVSFSREIAPILRANCLSCHGGGTEFGGLDLGSEGSVRRGGVSGGLIVPGDAASSLLVRRLRGLDGLPQMPFGFKPLSEEQIRLIERWIDEGARFSEVGGGKHWSYMAPVLPALPAVSDSSWPQGAIDRFVLARLESEGLAPSERAGKATLVRRVYLDLIGLPPTIREMEAYLSDTAPGAYGRLVDRLLDSPHFGERQAIPWLDLARYADTDGYEKDNRRSMWPYRDWVIEAFNDDMPFDRFTIEQIAGDLLPDATKDQLIATGFHRNTMHNREGGVDQGEQRWLTLVDRVGTTGTVWLGATLECAQCHDHKFDPFSSEDFYRFLAFFDNSDEPSLNVQDPVTLERVKRLLQRIAELEKVLPELKQESDAFKTAEKAVRGLRAEANALNSMTTLILREKSAYPPVTPMRMNGSYMSPGKTVSADTPGSLPPMQDRKDRMGLAKWLVSRENPLTARVVMNRLWEQYFGVGLVKTSGDFGTKGERPSHAGLLDWLAVEFMESGWSLKHMHRLIVTSATYRQSSAMTGEMVARDPENRLLARGPRFRLSAELIRDNAFSAAGILSAKVGGPSVFPDQPAGIWNMPYSDDKWTLSDGDDKYRRGVYTFWRRSSPYPAFTNFDAMSRESCTVSREPTNTPLQALTTLNDAAFMRAARGLARRTLESGAKSVGGMVEHGFRRCLVRRPSAEESSRLVSLYHQELGRYEADIESAKLLIKQDRGYVDGATVAESAAWTMVANVLLNLDETITKE